MKSFVKFFVSIDFFKKKKKILHDSTSLVEQECKILISYFASKKYKILEFM